MTEIIVVGGGASGMMAAVSAAEQGAHVRLIESNEKLGKKIYITGKGRCNLTNACDTADFFDNVFENKKFAYSAVYGFDSSMLISKLEEGGLSVKTERGNRVFPVSDKASDVTKALSALIKKNGVEVRLNEKVTQLICDQGCVKGVRTARGEKIYADAVILCCGGRSYPTTGSDGNGYRLASQAGHSLIDISPALVGLNSSDKWVHELTGLTLKNVNVALFKGDKKIGEQFGELLFTHKGVSGPTVLTLSCLCKDFSASHIILDLKPALSYEVMNERLIRDFTEFQNKDFKNSLVKLAPAALADKLVTLSGVDPEKKINQITAAEREKIAFTIKNLRINITGKGGFEEAIITMGGIDVKQIDPSSMRSKLVGGLYICGEMLALHGYTGGFNLQLAFSSGYLAGKSASCE